MDPNRNPKRASRYIVRHPPRTHSTLPEHIRNVSRERSYTLLLAAEQQQLYFYIQQSMLSYVFLVFCGIITIIHSSSRGTLCMFMMDLLTVLLYFTSLSFYKKKRSKK